MALTGSLSEVEAPDVIQLICLSRKTGVLTVVDGPERSRLYFDRGRLVHGASGELVGDEAVFHCLAKRRGEFAFEPVPVDCPKTVRREGESLILEGMRRIDHWERLREELPPPETRLQSLPDVNAELTAGAAGILGLADGTRNLETVAQESGLPEIEAYETILSLVRRGLMHAVAPHPAEAAEADPEFAAQGPVRPLTVSDLERVIRRVATL